MASDSIHGMEAVFYLKIFVLNKRQLLECTPTLKLSMPIPFHMLPK